jgi:hypothetical protein
MEVDNVYEKHRAHFDEVNSDNTTPNGGGGGPSRIVCDDTKQPPSSNLHRS